MSDINDPFGGSSEDDINALIGGANRPARGGARVKVFGDDGAVRKLTNEFKSLVGVIKQAREEMRGLADASTGVQAPGEGGQYAGRGGAGTKYAGALFKTFFSATGSAAQTAGQVAQRGWQAFGAGAEAAGTTRFGVITSAVSAGMQAIDARAERNRDYSLSADKMSLVYQQMYGLTQNQVANQYRTPMTNFKLGTGGINALMGMQATTGVSALQQASSVEAMRVMSGFSISGQQATGMIQQLAAPDVANRMFMMAGTGLIGPGGQQRSTTQVIQDLTRAAGLTDPRLAKSALAPGSITRANLSMMGVTGEMQDLVIQYANQNIEYRKKGGQGMYDPSSKAGQKLMGINENFAMEAEETERLKVKREEQFYKRQADNFADLERQTQSLTRVMGGLEDKISGIIGAGVSTKGWRGVLGTGLKLAGAVSMFVPGGQGVGLGLMAGGAMLGDPVEGDKTVPFGYGNSRVAISDLSSKSTFSKLHPTFRGRLEKMFAANPSVGIGGGFRDASEQEKMFRQRYTPTNEKTDIFWNGQYWKHTSGAPAAPPGRSMHEIGLAADLVGDLDWVQKNADKYGLKTFGGVNGEPWHVQPAELPNSRSEYEKSGAPWGTMGQPVVTDTQSPIGEHSGVSSDTGAPTSSGGVMSSYGAQMSIEEHIAATKAFVVGQRTPGRTKSKEKSTGSATPTNATPGSGGGIGGEAVARFLYAAGFRGKDLADALAIAWRESRWNPSSVARDSDDESYGLMQINMKPGLTDPEGNRKAWGIASNDALLDPATNARIAFEKYKWNKSHNRHPFADWSINGNPLANTQQITAEATRIAKDIEQKGGDPVAPGQSRSSVNQSTSISGNHTFNISPNITLNGSGSNVDLQQIARTVARLIEQEVRSNTLRSM